MEKFNTIKLKRSDFSVIEYDNDPEIKNKGDFRDEIAKMALKKLIRDGILPSPRSRRTEESPK